MRQSRRTIPTIPFGRAPRDINLHHNLFKAAECSNWVLHYAIPLLTGRLLARYLHKWKDLVTVWAFICSREITYDEIEECRELAIQFVKDNARLYYRRMWTRLKLLKLKLHAMLHLADTLQDLGPGHGWWCLPVERYNSTLKGKVKSKVALLIVLCISVLTFIRSTL